MSEEIKMVLARNTDTEIYRDKFGDKDQYYADSLFITQTGALGIQCGGAIRVLPIRDWHKLGMQEFNVTTNYLKQQSRAEVIEEVKSELFKVSEKQFNQKHVWAKPIESSPYVMWGAVEYVLTKLSEVEK